MTSIGIVGTGISGLTLALALQRQGREAVIYSDRTSAELATGPLPNTVARYGSTVPRERALGVYHWDGVEQGVHRIYFSALGTPLAFSGPLPAGSAIDFRLYLPRLLEDFEARGGTLVLGAVGPTQVAALAERHDLVVVASGRDNADAFFPRDTARSVHTSPQRMICAASWHGVDQREPPGLTFSMVPGVGEIFQMPFLGPAGQVSVILFEAVPGGPLAAIAETPCGADLAGFEALALRLLHEHAPTIAARVDDAKFHLTGPLDILQGAVTPTVRKLTRPVAPGRYVVALGDAWIVNDPVTGQGANLGSRCAEELCKAILEHDNYDEQFCRDLDGRLWTIAEPVCQFTNVFLRPPPAHVLDVLATASENQAVADAFTANFADPGAMCQAIGTPQGARAFLEGVRGGLGSSSRRPQPLSS